MMVVAALRQAFSRTWALLALGLGHLCAIRFLGDLSESVEAISYPEARRFAVLLNGLIQNLFLGLAPLRAAFVLLLLVLLWRTLRGRPLHAVAAIGQPGAFFAMLEEAGLTLAQAEALPDHYDFDSWSRLPSLRRPAL